MKRAAYKSAPIPSQLEHKFYRWGNNDAIFHKPITNDTLDIKQWINWIESDNPKTKAELQSGAFTNTYPTQHVRIPVDKEAVLRNGIVAPEDAHLILDYIDIVVKDEILYKNRLLMLDIIANNNWERPIYFTGGSFGDADYLWMKDYLQLTGVTYKLVPIKTALDPNNPFDMGRINTDQLYDIVMNWDWGNGESPDIYHDPETRKNAITYRSTLARLFDKLIQEKKIDKARDIIELGVTKLPIEYYEYYTLVEPYVSGYYQVGEKEKARELWEKLAFKYQEKLGYYASLDLERQYNSAEEIITQVERYRSVIDLLVINDDTDILKEKAAEFNNFLELFTNFYNADEGYKDEEVKKPEPASEVEDTLLLP